MRPDFLQSVLLAAAREGTRDATLDRLVEGLFADPGVAGLEAALGKVKTGNWPRVGQGGADALAHSTRRESLVRQRDFLRDRLKEVEQELAKLEKPKDKAKKPDGGKPGDAQSKRDAPNKPDAQTKNDAPAKKQPARKTPK